MLKPGYKTTEFWSTGIVALASLVASAADKLPARYAALAAAVSLGLYALGRGLAKAGATLGTVPTAPVPPNVPPTTPPQ